jgi:hypothetical protein
MVARNRRLVWIWSAVTVAAVASAILETPWMWISVAVYSASIGWQVHEMRRARRTP